MMGESYNKHYIRTDADGRILKGFSDAFEQPREGDICINEQGGYQFRLVPRGEENPLLQDANGAPLYRWDGSAAVLRTPEELAEDAPAALPTIQEQLDAIAAAIGEMAGEIYG